MSTNSFNRKSVSNGSCGLKVLPDDERLLTKAKRRKKAGDGTGWNEPDHLITPVEARKRRESGQNYGFALGVGANEWRLMAFDVEVSGVLPDEAQALIDEHALLTWDSVHTGRNRLVKASDDAFELLHSINTGHSHLSDGPDDDIELQTSGHAIAPGCEIAHKFCKGTKDGCPGQGIDSYELVDDNPVAPVLTEEVAQKIVSALDIEVETEIPSENAEPTGEVPDYDETDIAVAEKHLRTLQREYGYAFYDLSDRLKGGTGMKDDLRLCGGNLIDRSATDFVTISDLYGVMLVLGNESEERARELAYAYYSHRCEGDRFTKEGRPRKWLQMNDTYRTERLSYAVSAFDRGKFRRWLNQSNTPTERPWVGRKDGDYSDTTYGCVRFALQLLSGDLPIDYAELDSAQLQEIALLYELDIDRRTFEEILSLTPRSKDSTPSEGCISPSDYPSKRDVIDVARTLDEEHNAERTYEEALNRLRRDGIAVMACLKEGRDYRYYSYGLPHPDDAEYLRTDDGIDEQSNDSGGMSV